MPWIALADAVGATRFAARHPDVVGPVNAVAPEPITNAQFTEALGRCSAGRPRCRCRRSRSRPRSAREMAQELLLTGANVRPRRLEIAGYRFEYPRIDDALEALLK